MRADNDGEGGILALVGARADRQDAVTRDAAVAAHLIGLLGAAFLYGDGIITPAISVLAAVEGTEIAAPSLHALVFPAAVLVLSALFPVQRRGTASSAGVRAGDDRVVRHDRRPRSRPDRRGTRGLRAVYPGYAISFFVRKARQGSWSWGPWSSWSWAARRCMRIWATSAAGRSPSDGTRPSCRPVLVYFGQGALLLDDPRPSTTSSTGSPRMGARSARDPRHERHRDRLAGVDLRRVLADASGRPAWLTAAHPIQHTSATQFGQIYVSSMNWALMVACVGSSWGSGTPRTLRPPTASP